MNDTWLILLVVVGALLLATPAVRRWFGSNERRNLVDRGQNISVDQAADGLPGWYRTNFRLRRMPRGRRHQPPQNPSATRVRREPPASAGD